MLWQRPRALVQQTETVTLFIGVVEGPEDERRLVRFEGRELASRTYSQDDERILETLYESKDSLLVHTRILRRTIGLRTVYELRELSEPELGAEFPELSQLRSPLGLKEVLTDG